MNYREEIDAAKQVEYTEVLKIIRETGSNEDASRVLKSNALRTLAGYTEQSTEDNFNPYVKKYLDKLSYDEHNKAVKEARRRKDKVELQNLSRKAMEMAGYIRDENTRGSVNTFARSFVDRTLFDRKMNELYSAIQNGRDNDIDKAYKNIYDMTAYSENRPYGVINQYAQTFVDSRIDLYMEKGIILDNRVEEQQRAI